MSHVHLAMRIEELVDENPSLSVHDVMLAITLGRRGEPAANATILLQGDMKNTFTWYREFDKLIDNPDWLKALELVAFWHFDGLMSAGYFNSE